MKGLRPSRSFRVSVPIDDVVDGFEVVVVVVVVVVAMDECDVEGVDGVGEVVIAPFVDEGLGAEVDGGADAEVMTGLGMKKPWAQTRPHPSKQHFPDLIPLQSSSDLHNS